MIKVLKQSVELLPSISEKGMLVSLGEILGVPYNKGVFDIDKTKAICKTCVKRGHESVLEHLNITIGCITTIGTYKCYTRHRHCAFTIESTSFTDYSKELPVIFSNGAYCENDIKLLEAIQEWYAKHKRVKEARDFLPQCTAAKMIMTTNIRQWRYIMGLRSDPNDNPQVKELRDLILEKLIEQHPFFFDEIPIKQEWK